MSKDMVYGRQIKKALDYKGIKQRKLAALLAEYELDSSENKADQTNNVEELTAKYVSLVNRWVNSRSKPNQSNLIAISEVLNISVGYFTGEINLPLSITDESLTATMDDFRHKGYLYKYIQEYLGYDIDFLATDKDGNITEPFFYQIEREINAYLTARLDGLGVEKKGDFSNGKHTAEKK